MSLPPSISRDNGLLIKTFSPLVRKIAAGYARDGFCADDAFQSGIVGLLIASRRFDWSKPTRGFASYSAKWIEGEIRKARNAALQIVTNRLSTEGKKALKALVLHIRRHGPIARSQLQALAHEASVSSKAIQQAFDYLAPGSCYVSVIAEGEDYPSGPSSASAAHLETNNIQDFVEREYLLYQLERLQELIQSKVGRDADIIHRRHLSRDGATLRDIADQHSCSIEAVRKAEVKLLGRLRTELAL